MANLSEDIQCAGSDTRPPMLDRTDFASWQQRIRLYCRGKENGVNILKSIDEGPFQMGTFRETLAEGTEGALHLGPERPRVYSDLSPEDKERYNADDKHPTSRMLLEGSELTKEDRESQLYDDFEHFRQNKGETIHDYYVRFAKLINEMQNIKMTMYRMQLNSKFMNNMLPEWGRFGAGAAGYGGAQNRVGNANPGQARQVKCYNYNGGQDNAIDEDVDEQPVQDLALNVDNVFQADDCNAFDSDVDEAPTAQTMFMANLSYADLIYDKAGPSYDSDILSEVHEHDHYQDAVFDNSLTAELVTHKEQVELYERRARFELTEREQKIDEQLRIVITNRNIKEEKLKKELHSVKMKLDSTINYNKSMVEEVTSLKKDFKQKENKYLEEFLDMKALKEKVEDKLYKQEQSLQTVHMLCKPKPYYNEQNKVKIAPPDYSKENYLATFTPQKQLTLEQIFWSQDERRSSQKADHRLKTNQSVDGNLKKTCKKRITPTGLTEGERGFEQTKECYLTEVIPFFKTLKEHFEGIQRALTKEIKEMKDVFEELEAEVDQNVVDRKHDEIEWKNLLIAHDNLIADCLSKEVFYVATNSELNVSRFTEMHDAHTIVEARCLELEAEISNLRDKIENDNHNELVNRFSKK
ncbi:hypothetical protein Tco_0558517 [Tanacetum coccineum]